MEELSMCRICLAEDLKMYTIANTPLQEVYESLTWLPLELDRRPSQVCYICCAILENCFKLKERCLKAEEFFRRLLSSDAATQSLLKDKALRRKQLQVAHLVINLGLTDELVCDDDGDANEDLEYELQAPEESTHVDFNEESVKDSQATPVTQPVLIVNQGVIVQESADLVQNPGTSLRKVVNVEKTTKRPEKSTPLANQEAPQKTSARTRLTFKKIQLEIENDSDYDLDMADDPIKTAESDDEPLFEFNIEKDNFELNNYENEFHCETCNEIIDNKQKMHVCAKPFSCKFCKQSFIEKSQLETHRRIHMIEKKYTCDVCSKKLNSFAELKEHIYVHGDHICSVCQKGFLSAARLRVHMKEHDEKYNLQCEFCNKTFTDKTEYEMHIPIHSGEKPYSCDICDKSFKRFNSLKVHIRYHTGEKPFKCDVCKKGFPVNAYLKAHMRLHSSEKPFLCEACPKAFNRRFYLVAHMRCHSDKSERERERVKCPVCNKCFSDKAYLSKHARVHTGELFSCTLCRKTFLNKSTLIKHIRGHNGVKPFMCDVCGQCFREKAHFSRHLRVHTGEKPYSCDLCGKRFTQKNGLEGHIRVHTGEKPFFCTLCKKHFNNQSNLKRHISRHIENYS